jgi:catechol 2,3-dioxygenase-like lactoylglutathione lyase family enzyme
MNGRRSFPVALWPTVIAALVAAYIGPACALARESALIQGAKLELFVRDPVASTRFYATLGFEVTDEHPDGYTTLMNGATVVSLSPATSWLPASVLEFLRTPPIGTEIVLYARRLRAVRDALVAAGYAPGAIERRPWGREDFRVHDPAGYYVRITEPPTDE